MDNLVNFFKALSDKTRLRMMLLLLKREHCVCELTEILDLSQPKISKHLAKLRDLGLVNVRRDARFMYYSLSLDYPAIKSVLAILSNYIPEYEQLKIDSDNVKGCTPIKKLRK